MQDFFSFVTHHWALWLALLGIVILLVVEESKGTVRGISRLSPQEATKLINREAAIVLDMRPMEAYQEGHIVGAINIPQAELETKSKKLSKYKDKSLIVICPSEQAITAVSIKLKQQGFNQIYTITEGLAGWRQAGFPLSKRDN